MIPNYSFDSLFLTCDIFKAIRNGYTSVTFFRQTSFGYSKFFPSLFGLILISVTERLTYSPLTNRNQCHIYRVEEVNFVRPDLKMVDINFP